MADKYPFLLLATVKRFEQLAEDRGVSEIARSPRGFLGAYRVARKPEYLTYEWRVKREGFIARHMAQLKNEKLFEKNGEPTRRHLALIMWAYSPAPNALPID